jgi:hypothetical protein
VQAHADRKGAEPHDGEVGEQRERDAGDVERLVGDPLPLQREEDHDREQQPVQRDRADAGDELLHRASPTMTSPVRYSGRSGSISQASANITAGPTTQLSTSDRASARRSATTCPMLADASC